MFDFAFFATNALLGLGLSMDAFSISLANGLNEPKMKKRKTFLVAGVFAFFQLIMPMIGWVCVHTILQYFQVLEKIIPWIAFILLAFIGGKMVFEGIKGDEEKKDCKLCFSTLLVQGVATSIDALSVGLTIAGYNVWMALVASLIIGVVTLVICLIGLMLGKKVGTKFAGKANILGGVILIAIGLKILITALIG